MAMAITLSVGIHPVRPAVSPEEAWDVKQVKIALTCLGFYNPDPATGMTDEADAQFRDALYAFQRRATIFFDDTEVGPGSTTERILNQELARREGYYVWRTVGDEKVRDEHARRDGRRFSWDSPPNGEYPGEDYNCRCWAEPLVPPYHPWIDWVRKKEAERRTERVPPLGSGAMGMPVPEEPLPPGLQEASASTLIWGGARMAVAACWANRECRAWMLREGAGIILENTYHLPPKTLPAFPDAEKDKPIGGRKRWIDSKGKIYEWDSQHGEVEVYDKTGKHHEGGFDPHTGKQRSPRDKTKKANK